VTEIMDELKSLAKNNVSFDTSTGRLDFIDALMKRKMHKEGKNYWGGKTQADLYELHKRHPDACFFIMVRDIRDVFASMCNTGSFAFTAEEAAALWKKRILDFREFVSRCKPKGMEICYQELVSKPETVLSKACQLIGLEYNSDMLSYHKKNLTLFQNPHGHLSSEQLKEGLNTQSVGRWKKDLEDRDLDSIMAIAGELVDGR